MKSLKRKRFDNFIPKATKMHSSPADKVISVAIYFVYAIFAFVCVYPFYYIFINTISNNDLSARGKIIFVPHEVHFTNYVEVLKIEGLFQAMKVSVARTLIGTVLTVIVAAFLGFMFTRESLWHRKLWFRLVAATMYFNAGIIPWYLTMRNLGLTNNFWGYIWPVAVQPFYIILCKTYVESVPSELQDAAEIDGAGTLMVFFKIIIPVIKPIIATIAVFAAVAQWNSFQDTLLLVTDKKLYTLQFTLYNYMQSADSLASLVNSSSTVDSMASILAHAQTNTSIRMTVTMVVVTPIMLVYPFFQRFFTKGIMVGAVKG
ncbi:MAG: carbohydrate ABC transporter permease [Lachnospiraceae bacterium]|nr:carbohydrate ABC transporter permease [Lachnospiraceae bacterium]